MFKLNDILSCAMADDCLEKISKRQEELNKTIEERKASFEKSDVETREAILKETDELTKEVRALEEEAKQIEELKATFSDQEKRMSLMATAGAHKVEKRNADKYDTPEYRAAYVNAIRTGDYKEIREIINRVGSEEEKRELTTGTSNVPIPTIMQGYVETAWEKADTFVRRVTKSFIKGLFKVPYESAADDAVVHTEGGDAPDEESLTLGGVLLQPAFVKKWISYTDELEALSPDEFMRYLADEVVYRVYLKVNQGIIVGAKDTNGKGINGIVNSSLTTSKTIALGFNAVNSAIGELADEASDPIVVMNKKTFYNNVMALQDLQGRPIYQIQIDNTGKARPYYGGYEVEFCSKLKDYDAATGGTDVWAIVGDFSGYRLNLPNGNQVTFIKDELTRAKEDVVELIGKMAAAGDVVKLKHFVKLVKPADPEPEPENGGGGAGDAGEGAGGAGENVGA